MIKLLVLLLFVASTAYGEIYTWKDARGTLFYTNSLYEIPARYRARAKLLDVATGKKVPITAVQPAPQTGPTGSPGPQAVPQPAPVTQPRPQTTLEQQAPAAGVPVLASPAPLVRTADPSLRSGRRAARQRRSATEEE